MNTFPYKVVLLGSSIEPYLNSWSIQVGHLDPVEVTITPVQLLVGIVNGDAIRPVDIRCCDEGSPVTAIQTSTLNLGCTAPVSPVDVAVRETEGTQSTLGLEVDQI